MNEDLILKLIEFLEGASPILWEAAVRQVWLGALGRTLWALLCGGITAALIPFAIYSVRRYRQANGFNWWDFTAGIAGVLAFAFFLLTLGLLQEAVGFVLNPTYYAIVNLTKLVK